MKNLRFVFLTFLAMMLAVSTVRAQSRLDVWGNYDYKMKMLRVYIKYYGDDLRGGTFDKVFVYQGTTLKGEYWLSGVEKGFALTNLTLPEGSYTFKTTANTFQEFFMIDDKGYQSRGLGEKSFNFKVCNHTFDANGSCTQCKANETPDMVDGVYELKNLGNLKWYAEVTDGPAKLTNDIVLNKGVLNADGSLSSSSKTAWTPFDTRFDFDGNNHSISGLYVRAAEQFLGGLFNNVNADITIKNLALKDSYVESTYSNYATVSGFIANANWHNINIINCLNQATVRSNKYVAAGFSARATDLITLTSCINVGKIYSGYTKGYVIDISTGKMINCVALSGCTSSKEDGTVDTERPGQTFVTSSGLAQGAAALILNNQVTDGTQAWYQRIGTDALPYTGSKGGDTVYGGFKHGETAPSATNNSTTAAFHAKPFDSNATTEEDGGHGYSMVNGVCHVCAFVCSHASYTNGVCDRCHYHCPHTPHLSVNGFRDYCTICNIDMTEMYEPASLNAEDGFYEVGNAGQLFWMAGKLVSAPRTNLRLVSDIKVNDGVLDSDGNPVAAEELGHIWVEPTGTYRGTIDGCHHTISGLYGNSFLDQVDGAVLKNFGIIDSYFEKSSVARLIYSSTVQNCFVRSTVKDVNNAFVQRATDTDFLSCYYSGKDGMKAFCNGVDGSVFKDCCTSTTVMYNGKITTNSDPASVSNCKTSLSKANFASGVAAYTLNNGVTDGSQAWYQTIGTDAYPVYSSNGENTVYRVRDCQGNIVYCNTEQLDEDNHLYDAESMICRFCGHGKPAVLSEDGYYEISTLGNLLWFREQSNLDASINGRLVNDIVMNKVMEYKQDPSLFAWDGIGTDETPYSGKFDGQGYKVSGLYSSTLFYQTDGATLSRIGLTDSYIVSSNSGSLVKYASNSNIESCYVHNVYNDGGDYIALAKELRKSSITGCYVYNPKSISHFDNYVVHSIHNSTISNCSILENGESDVFADNKSGTIQNSKVLTAAQFASGEATWLLNGGKADGTQAWYQKIGKDNMPVYVKADGNTVYGFTDCKGNVVYENAPDFEGHFAVDNGTALVCKFCGETVSGEADKHDYLALTAVDGSVTIGMAKTGGPNAYILQFSKSKSIWTTIELSATNNNIVTLENGETCYFRHGTQTVTEKISNNQNNHWSFTMTGTGTIKASGNVMSLLDAKCEKNSMSGYPNQHMFTGLFKGCDKLTVAPKLPATQLGQFCYMYMFEGTSITETPELPATTIPDGAYNGMFRNCRNLTTVSPLPGTSLARRAYYEMFYGCEKLTSVEIANITTMDSRDDSSNASFYNWLEGAALATNGVLKMPDALMGNTLIFLPDNWMAVSIDGHHFVAEKDSEDNDIWIWDGLAKATLKLVCTHNANHKSEVSATGDAITSDITTEATCTEDGVRTYTAKVTVEGVEYTTTKDVVEAALGHDYQYGICVRCGDMPTHFDAFTFNDGDPYLLTHDCTVGSLTYKRNYNVGVWSAWYMPFEVNASYLNDNGLTPAFIEGIHNYDDDEDGTIDRTVMEIVKISNGRLRAGTPILVRATEGYSEQLNFSDVTMKANTDLNNIHTETATTKFDFIGTYSGTTVAGAANIYSLSTNTGAMVHRTGTILPLRWYCQIEQKPSFIEEETPAPALARAIYIRVIGEEDQVTGIRTLYDEADQTLEHADGVFDLSGRKFAVPQHGKINIINGKKHFVR